jgi:hypothetical protein
MLCINVSMGIAAFGGSTGTGPVELIPGVRGYVAVFGLRNGVG